MKRPDIAAKHEDNRQTLIAEIERLLTFGEGEHAITQALQVKPKALERRLHRAGRPDLIPRIFAHQAQQTDQRNHNAEYTRIAYNRKTAA